MEPVAALVAMDWSDPTQDICLVDVATGQTEALMLKPTPAALEAWATAWRSRCGGRPLAVCLEPSRGPLLDALLKDDLLVLYPIHPTPRAKYREACSPRRAKAAPRDADYRLDRRVQPRDRRKAWRPAHAKTRTRQYLVDYRRRLVHDRTRLRHRLTAVLNAQGPPICHWVDDIRTRLVGDVRLRWPTVEARTKVRPAPLEQFCHAHHAVRRETLSCRLAAITDAVPLTTEQAVMTSSGLMSNA